MKFFLKNPCQNHIFVWNVGGTSDWLTQLNSQSESTKIPEQKVHQKGKNMIWRVVFFENTLPLLQKYICNVYIQRRQKYLLLKLLFVYIVSYLFTISRTRRYVGNIRWQKKSCEKLNFTSFFLVYKCVV